MNDAGSAIPSGNIAPIDPPKSERPRATARERLLLPVALAVGVLYDRLAFAPLSGGSGLFPALAGVFWLCYLVAFYAFYWKKAAKNPAGWYVAGGVVLLVAWNFIFSGAEGENREYTALTYFTIPAVLMAHAQYIAGGYSLKEAGKIALSWFLGWFATPFTGLAAFGRAIGGAVLGESKSLTRRLVLGLAVTLPVLLIVFPLLMGADRVFSYYVRQFFGGLNPGSFVFHTLVAAVAFALFYSFLWNIGLNERPIRISPPSPLIDPVICNIVLAAVNALYLLFCAVQFTYLFAGAGLPGGMTYSEYAREGFAQTVAVCAVNLGMFGIFLRLGGRSRLSAVFLALLLGQTAVMLLSGFVRLRLYIGAYGLTWLRLLSFWFIVYLAAVIAVCGIRMVKQKLPAMAICALILLGWYAALGYANPDGLIAAFNRAYNYIP